MQVLSWYTRIRDTIDERLAWQRALSRQRREAFAARAAEEARRNVAEQAARVAAEETNRRAAASQAAAASRATDASRAAALQAALAEAEGERLRALEEARGVGTERVQEASAPQHLPADHRPAVASSDLANDVAWPAARRRAREATERANRNAAEQAAHRIAQAVVRYAAKIDDAPARESTATTPTPQKP